MKNPLTIRSFLAGAAGALLACSSSSSATGVEAGLPDVGSTTFDATPPRDAPAPHDATSAHDASVPPTDAPSSQDSSAPPQDAVSPNDTSASTTDAAGTHDSGASIADASAHDAASSHDASSPHDASSIHDASSQDAFVNACTDNNGGCDPNATCTPDGANASCSCKTGYFGSGTTCALSDKCAASNGGCDTNATCTQTGQGTDSCACKSGFYGTGETCTACAVCPGSDFQETACTSTANAVCKACSGACMAGEYETAACNATADEVCSACATCPTGYRVTTTCGGTTNTGCTFAGALLLGVTSGGAVTGVVYNGTTWATAATVTGAVSGDDLALALLPSTGAGVGLLRGSTNALLYTTWSTTAGWSALAQLNTDTTQGVPALAATGSTAYAVFWGENYKYYGETYSGTWTGSAQAVLPSGLAATAQPCAPSPGALAPLAAGASLVFVNGSCGGTENDLYGSDLVTGVWGAESDVGGSPSASASQRPAVVALASGPQLLAVFIEDGTSQLMWASRTNATWTTPEQLPGALTNVPVGLAPLAGSGAVLAFEGTDGNLYTATFSGPAWGAPTAAFTPNVAVAATPTVIQGVGTDVAEMVYVDTTGALNHSRLIGTTWGVPTNPAPGLTGFVHAALAGP